MLFSSVNISDIKTKQAQLSFWCESTGGKGLSLVGETT